MRSKEQSLCVRMAGTTARLGLVILLLGLMPGMAQGQSTAYDFGWEDGGTILGSYGNLINPLNVAMGTDATDPLNPITVLPHSGSAMLQVTESPHSSTPQAFVAYVQGLSNGDVVDASYWGWDSTAGASPSLRIGAHWAVSGDINSYAGSAGSNLAYTDGTGWNQVAWTWTLDTATFPGADALVIEVRLYSTPSTCDPCSTDFWIDDLQVTAPDTATVKPPLAIDLASFTATPQGSSILLEWETAMELDNLGFNLRRADSPAGARVKLNTNLIPSTSPGTVLGGSYEFVDESAQPGATYYYWLEDVDVYGAATLHGPVSANVPSYLRILPARRRPLPGLPVLVGE